MTVSVNVQDKKYQNPSAAAIVGSVLAGNAVNNAVMSIRHKISPNLMKNMIKLSDSLTSDEYKNVNEAIVSAIGKTGLDKKGVGIIKASAENSKAIQEIMTCELDRGFLKFLPKVVKDMIGAANSTQMQAGQNAFYTFKSKKVVLPEKGLSLAGFHEIGHAMNANLSHVGKALQKCRALSYLAIPIALIALYKTKKAEGEEPKNKFDKVTTFIKNNAGKLTFAAFLPTVIEEGLATLKGNKIAKQLLSPDLAKKVAKTNTIGFLSYVSLAAFSGLGVYLGVKVKDLIASRKPVEENK